METPPNSSLPVNPPYARDREHTGRESDRSCREVITALNTCKMLSSYLAQQVLGLLCGSTTGKVRAG